MKARLAREQIRVTFAGKILCLVISAFYIVIGIALLGLTIYYMNSVFGINEPDYAYTIDQCKGKNANPVAGDKPSPCKGMRYTFAAIIITFILTILLIGGGIFLAVMVFCRLFPKHWWIIWLVINVLILLLSFLILLLIAMASHDNNLQAKCLQIHEKYAAEYGQQLKSKCQKGSNFVSFIRPPKCPKDWDKFESRLRSSYQAWWIILISLLVLNLIGFILFLIVILCLRNKKGDPNTLEIVNLPPNITESDLKKKFPHAKQIVIDKKNGTAKVVFWKQPDVTEAYNKSGLLKLGTFPPTVGWLRPEELYIEDIPLEASESDLLKEFPTAKAVKFQDVDEPEFKRIATVIFPTAAEQKKAYTSSPRKKLGPQRLHGGAHDGGGGLNGLEVSNLPPNTTEDDLKKKFPTSTDIKMGDGRAVVHFERPEDTQKAYDDADMVKLGKPKLGWMRPEEFYVSDVPLNVREQDFLKEFPTAKSVKFQKGPGGKRIATVVFPSENDQKKAYNESDWNKPGPQKLTYGGTGPPDGGPNDLQLTNIPPGVTENDLKKRFPKAKKVKLNNGNAFVRFGNPGDANKAYDDSNMLKLGRPKLGFLRPDELYITDVPAVVTDKNLLKDFPTAKGVKFQKGEGGKRIATIVFANENEQKKAYGNSTWKKLGPQKLAYGGDGGIGAPSGTSGIAGTGGAGGSGVGGTSGSGIVAADTKSKKKIDDGTNPGDIDANEELNDDELARKLWKTPEPGYSNISNLFHPKLYISNLPTGVTRAQLITHFEGAIKADIFGKLGILEFETPVKAAHAYNKSHKKPLNGTILKVSIHAPRKKKKGSEKDVASKSGKSKASKISSRKTKRTSRPSIKNKIQPATTPSKT